MERLRWRRKGSRSSSRSTFDRSQSASQSQTEDSDGAQVKGSGQTVLNNLLGVRRKGNLLIPQLF